jgi:hypothetical protein
MPTATYVEQTFAMLQLGAFNHFLFEGSPTPKTSANPSMSAVNTSFPKAGMG